MYVCPPLEHHQLFSTSCFAVSYLPIVVPCLTYSPWHYSSLFEKSGMKEEQTNMNKNIILQRAGK